MRELVRDDPSELHDAVGGKPRADLGARNKSIVVYDTFTFCAHKSVNGA